MSANFTGRYKNLLSASSTLSANGAALKILGGLLVVLSSFGGYYMGLPFGLGIVVVGLVCGIGLYMSGVFMAAAGEALLALADIAVNTTTSG